MAAYIYSGWDGLQLVNFFSAKLNTEAGFLFKAQAKDRMVVRLRKGISRNYKE